MKGRKQARFVRVERLAGGVLRVAWLSLAGMALIGSGPPVRAPRSSEGITALLALGPHEGECTRCHSAHGDGELTPYPNALIGPNENALCDRCHTTPWLGGSYGGPLVFGGSSHGQSSSMIWPGPDPPARNEAGAAGKCVNCHDPHGRKDAHGLIPFLGVVREEALCNTCHDGNPAVTNIQFELRKTFHHPTEDKTGIHSGPNESQPADFAAAPLAKRHAECEDCHDPHVAYADGSRLPLGAELSKVNLGVSRVRVTNGGAGQAPVYTFTAGVDTLSQPLAEYQLCFKCHSSWTVQPSGQTDLAMVLNPANPSYHPVESPGGDAAIAPGAFVSPWSAASTTRCGSCHGSDAGTTEGPHGSSYRYILRNTYQASPARRTMASDEICFLCHKWDVYANPNASPSTLAYSRFNPPGAEKGHAQHVGEEQVPCYSCHVTHGSTSMKHLLVTGRNPGIVAYTETAGGGSCSPVGGCHGTETYAINYAR